ncbi:MAG: alpha-L-fucosidase [Armatimonadota bacterium]
MARRTKTTRTREQTLEWFQQARFGMFIHWGVYALLGKGEWIRNVGHIPQEEYDKLPPRFTAKKFDPDAWADLAKRAGMRYMVVTTKHHDGFCMFDAHNTDWKVTNTPFGRDAIAEITKAFERKGIPVGFYYSIMDWWHDDYLPRLAWEAEQRPEEGHDVMRYIEYMREHIKQLMTEYRPAPFVLWWDGGWMNKPEELGGQQTNALARRLKPDIIINDRAFTREDLVTPEQRIPPTGLRDEEGRPLVWEACITMTSHWWGYDKEETVYKSPEYLIRMLVDIVSKGGNLLLNVGPKPDGTIQKEFVERLEAIGAWMDKYSEAIYGTTASPFNLLPFYGRVTTKGERLYVHVFEWPAEGVIRLPGLRNQIKRACVVEKGRPRLTCERDGDDWVIALPETAPDPVASVFAVDLNGAPEVEPMVLGPDAEGRVKLPVLYGFLDGPHGMRIRYEAEGGVIHAGNWINPKDSVEWTVTVPRRGDYRIWLDYRVEPGQGGSEVEFIINGKDAPRIMPNGMIATTGGGGVEGGQRQVVKTASTGGDFKRKQAAVIRLKKGANTIKVMVPTIRRQQAMDLRGIELVPVG